MAASKTGLTEFSLRGFIGSPAGVLPNLRLALGSIWDPI